MGLNVQVIRVGNDNLFQSTVFSETISNLIGCKIEMMDTTGAVGAAKAAGVANGIYSSIREAVSNNQLIKSYEPIRTNGQYEKAYQDWLTDLQKT